jgi:hypothetical protein
MDLRQQVSPPARLSFACELGSEPLGELFSDRSVIEQLQALQAGVTLMLSDLSLERASRRRPGLPDVVAGDAQRPVAGDVLRAELEQVADEAQVRLGGEEPLLLRDVLLEDVGLQRAVELAEVDALPLGGHDVHA